MRPRVDQPDRFFVTGKTHKFESIEDISLNSLKLRFIVDQTVTYITMLQKSSQNTSVL